MEGTGRGEAVQPEPSHGGTVLIVEDEEFLREVTERVLRGAGFEVVAVADGKAGIAELEAHAEEIAAVVLDLSLPGIDGGAALRRMRAIRPDVFVVVTTGGEAEDLAEDLRSDPELALLRKPYPQSDLVALLREAGRR